MSSAPTVEEIWNDARWLVQALDPASELARVIEMDSEGYRAASFLDDRILQQPVRAHALPWVEIAAATPSDARSDARWIFHIGHVGSTLIARMLGETDAVLSVREPRILRDVAALPAERRAAVVEPLRKLLSRTFEPSQAALVKATSFVSEIAAELAPENGRALLLHVPPRTYVATILAGPNSRVELLQLSASRRERLAGRGIELPELRTEAELAAAAWACEMTALEASAEAMAGSGPMWADFDLFLVEPAASLGAMAAFFGFEASPERIAEIAQGPLMRRYSKALEHDYSPQLRRELLDEAAAEHRADIESALAMLNAAAETAPMLGKALKRARSES